MKKIVVSQRLILNQDYHEVREALDIQWGLLFEQLDFLPIILPYEYSFEKYFNSMQIDGIVLTGGNDLSSLNYSKESKKRDIFEKKLVKYGITNNIPILGICRGMQIISEYFGSDFESVANQVNTRNELKINNESKYYNRLMKISNVNSFHNYCIKNISEELLVSATDFNGIIKAIEHKKYNIFGQMWHSEREEPFSNDELNLIKEFFNDQ